MASLVSLFFMAIASAKSPENKVLTGTIQFPSSVSTISPLTIVYRGDNTPTQVDHKNKAISFQLLRQNSQFSFKLLIAEPQDIEYVPYDSKYQMEAMNTFKFQRVKEGKPYRYYMLTLIPSIAEGNTGKVTYSWNIHEATLRHPEKKIPDEAIVLHAPANWISHLDGKHGFDFPTICVKSNIGSQDEVKDMFTRISLASMDSGALRGEKVKVAMKRDKNRIIHAALPTPVA